MIRIGMLSTAHGHAQSYAACLRAIDGVELVGVADDDAERGRAFAERFGVHSELHTGAYVACISLAVMLAFPLWARVARRVDTLHLLVWTQAAAPQSVG